MPKNGGPWQPCIRWAFLKGGRVSTSKALEDRFLNSVLIAWSAVKEGMQHTRPSTEEEIDRQPLFWNPWFTSGVQSMLGTRTRLSWGPFEAGLARTFRDWKIVCSLPSLEREQILKRYKGGKIIFHEIQRAVLSTDFGQVEDTQNRWVGIFPQLNVLLGVKALLNSGYFLLLCIQMGV